MVDTKPKTEQKTQGNAAKSEQQKLGEAEAAIAYFTAAGQLLEKLPDGSNKGLIYNALASGVSGYVDRALAERKELYSEESVAALRALAKTYGSQAEKYGVKPKTKSPDREPKEGKLEKVAA